MTNQIKELNSNKNYDYKVTGVVCYHLQLL